MASELPWLQKACLRQPHAGNSMWRHRRLPRVITIAWCMAGIATKSSLARRRLASVLRTREKDSVLPNAGGRKDNRKTIRMRTVCTNSKLQFTASLIKYLRWETKRAWSKRAASGQSFAGARWIKRSAFAASKRHYQRRHQRHKWPLSDSMSFHGY